MARISAKSIIRRIAALGRRPAVEPTTPIEATGRLQIGHGLVGDLPDAGGPGVAVYIETQLGRPVVLRIPSDDADRLAAEIIESAALARDREAELRAEMLADDAWDRRN